MERYLQVSKVSKLLDCNKNFVYQLIRDGRLQAINLGQRQTRISSDSLVAFLRDSKVDPEQYFE